MQDTILKIENISKFYPGVTALSNVSFEVNAGEVRGLCGENGAGKSTLIKCVMGVERPDKGRILMNYNGEWVENTSAMKAQSHGVYANYQNVNISPELSIAENYYLGRQPKGRSGRIDWKKMYRDSQKIIDQFDMNVNPRQKISSLPIAMQAMVTISKISVSDDLKIVIFDEPTALLKNEKVETLYKFIKELKRKGVSVIYISHRLEEIMDVCDTVTILKDGTYIDTKAIENVTKDSLIKMMVGRELSDIYNIKKRKSGDELLRIENFSDSFNFKNINFSLHAGEIIGFAGLVGSGRSEIMRALCGVEKRLTGDTYIRGEKVRIKNPSSALEHGIGFLTEDRRMDGLALILPIKINVNMNSYNRISKSGIISLKKESERAKKYSSDVNVKTPSIMQLAGNLSGGNQQKVVIAKLLCRDPDILIFDEPTVGVDVGAKEEIYKIMEKLIANGKGIILISSYLPEVMGLSDRLFVMAQGTIKAEFNLNDTKKISEEDVLKKASDEC